MSTAPVMPRPVTVEMVVREGRERFDAAVRELTGVDTPVVPISEAFLAVDSAGVSFGLVYVQLAYHIAPWVIDESAPSETMARLTEAVTEHLRGLTVLDPPDAERTLAYDVYVPEGAESVTMPEGFELLPVRVWRKRVI
jgi:hypothetical protein